MRARTTASRRLAAFLASIALVSVMVRPVLACDMGHQGQAVSASPESADPHAHHGMVSDESVPNEKVDPVDPIDPRAPSAPSPAGLGCDHVVGCAVMALSSTQTVVMTPITMRDAAPRTTDAALDAPMRALEPPPPRR